MVDDLIDPADLHRGTQFEKFENTQDNLDMVFSTINLRPPP